MIWTYIYEFLVMYVFGGMLAKGETVSFYNSFIGYLYDYSSNSIIYDPTTSYLGINTTDLGFSSNYSMPFGNYLALITTIIIMALIVWFAIWLTIWVFKLVSHAFLLK